MSKTQRDLAPKERAADEGDRGFCVPHGDGEVQPTRVEA
jgi:hypothetical protein